MSRRKTKDHYIWITQCTYVGQSSNPPHAEVQQDKESETKVVGKEKEEGKKKGKINSMDCKRKMSSKQLKKEGIQLKR